MAIVIAVILVTFGWLVIPGVSLVSFILEDFYGAVFYHSLLLPVISVILGLLGGGIGKAARLLLRPTTTPA